MGDGVERTDSSAAAAFFEERLASVSPVFGSHVIARVPLEMSKIANLPSPKSTSASSCGSRESTGESVATLQCSTIQSTDSAPCCPTCDHKKVMHGCGHYECVTAACRPAWFQQLEARRWLVPRTLKRMLDARLFETIDRCSDCRPEGRCLQNQGDCPRYCNFVFKRGTCKYGAQCEFCHLHGRGAQSCTSEACSHKVLRLSTQQYDLRPPPGLQEPFPPPPPMPRLSVVDRADPATASVAEGSDSECTKHDRPHQRNLARDPPSSRR